MRSKILRREIPSKQQRDDQMAGQSRQAVAKGQRQQFSSALLFVAAIVLVNLLPFEQDLPMGRSSSGLDSDKLEAALEKVGGAAGAAQPSPERLNHIRACIAFVKLMFTNPARLGGRAMRYTQAEARVLGKMAKVWYIKKKIKKLSKKLKKHTIAVPVFTAIPIYEHSY